MTRRFLWALALSLLWTGLVRGLAAELSPHARIFLIVPDVAVAMVVAFSLYRPAQAPLAVAGFAVLSGVLHDLQTSTPTGIHALCFLLLALAAQRARRSLLLASAWQVVAVAFFALFVEAAVVLALTEGLSVRPLWALAFVTLRAAGAALLVPYLLARLDRRRGRDGDARRRATVMLLSGAERRWR